MERIPLKPLDVDLLRQIIKPAYVQWINNQITQQKLFDKFLLKMYQTPKIGGALWRLGIRDQRLTAYAAYLTLKPLENLLKIKEMYESDRYA